MKKIVFITPVLILTLLILGCGLFGPDASIIKGAVNDIKLEFDLSGAESAGYVITRVHVTLVHQTTGNVIEEDLDVDPEHSRASGTINDLKVGVWDLTVSLYEHETEVASGTAEVEVIANQITEVYIKINLHTGGIDIDVDWGGVDPEVWTKYEGNPVITPGTGFESYHVFFPWVIKDGSTYKMWYNGYRPTSACDPARNEIGYATSPDGMNWTKHTGNPVLHATSGSSSWAYERVGEPTVIKDGDTYKMWFDGYSCGYDDGIADVGYATSTNGTDWTMYEGNPVLESANAPSVIFNGTTYRMWYSDFSTANIYFAISSDGVNWTKYAGNPVLTNGYGANVLFNGSTFHIWYTSAGLLHYAVSLDGITWVPTASNPVMTPTQGNWESDQVGWPVVILDDGSLKMWYTAHKTFDTYQIGYATSP